MEDLTCLLATVRPLNSKMKMNKNHDWSDEKVWSLGDQVYAISHKLCCYDYTYKSIMLKCVGGLALL